MVTGDMVPKNFEFFYNRYFNFFSNIRYFDFFIIDIKSNILFYFKKIVKKEL